jgi:GMC oxidoreductase
MHEIAVIGGGAAGTSVVNVLVEREMPLVWFPGDRKPTWFGVPGTTVTAYRRTSRNIWPTLVGDGIAIDDLLSPSSPKNRTRGFRVDTAGYGTALKLRPENFVLRGTLAHGGLTNFWGAEVNFFDASDMELPNDIWRELHCSYARIAARVPISGYAEAGLEASEFPELVSQPPLPIPPPAQHLLDVFGKTSTRGLDGLRLRRSWLAVRTAPSATGGSCTLCNGCLWGCKEGAIYSASHTVDRLSASPGVKFEAGWIIERIDRAQDGFVLTARSNDGISSRKIGARRVFLAAGAPSSTRLALGCAGLYDQWFFFGHTFGFAFAVVMPRFIGRAVSESGYALALLSWELNDPGTSLRTGGAFYSPQGLPDSEFIRFMPLTRPGAIGFWKHIQGATLVGIGFLPSEFSRNEVRIRCPGGELEFRSGSNDEVKARAASSLKVLNKLVRRARGLVIPSSLKIMNPGAEFHYGGTLPHGGRRPTGTDMFGQLPNLPGLHVVDGSVLPRLSSRHPTLTIMANADRIARAVCTGL